MPNKYKRKTFAVTRNWSQEALKAAISAVKNNGTSIRAAAIQRQVPKKTLERRLKTETTRKSLWDHLLHLERLMRRTWLLTSNQCKPKVFH